MKLRRIGLAVLVCLAAIPALANSWTGILVNSSCYDAIERSVNPNDVFNHAYRDTDLEIRLCTPNAKTKSFSIVDNSGFGFRLDPIGNMKAAELVQNAGKKHLPKVTVTGEMGKHLIEVGSISIAK